MLISFDGIGKNQAKPG